MEHHRDPQENASRVSGVVTLREPHPVRATAVLCGAVATGAWLVAFGLLATTLPGYLLWTLLAGALAWLASWMLARAGDRGAAVGVAAATGVAWTVAVISVVTQWARLGVWPV